MLFPGRVLNLNPLVTASLLIAFCSLVFGCASKPPARGLEALKVGVEKESITARTGQNLASGDQADFSFDLDYLQEKPFGAGTSEEGQGLTQSILITAFSQMGKVYRYGGNSPTTGFDCAGFVQWVFAQHGVTLPRSTKDQSRAGTPVPKEALRPGDLLFYWRGRHRRSKHVGIYTGEGKFIHSPHTGSVITEAPAFDDYRQAMFIGARRVYDDQEAAPLALDRKRILVRKALAANRSVAARRSESGRPMTYVVKKGDTLWNLARRFGVTTSHLMKANGLSARHILNIGQRLSIP